MISSFSSFILEKRLFLYTRSFRLKSLKDTNIYTKEQIENWKSIYGFDDFATCVLISLDRVRNVLPIEGLTTKTRDIKNKHWFDDSSINNKGVIINDSETVIDGETLYLYVFYKNSTEGKRARQNHGFKYEAIVKKENNLKHLPYTDKWDAFGDIEKKFIDNKVLVDNKSVTVIDGNNITDIDGYDSLSSDFKKDFNWNIKSMANKTDVEMGDFLRISGYSKDGDRLVYTNNNVDDFMYCVSFHDNSTDRIILEEYFIIIPLDIWKTYLPNIVDNLEEFENMYRDLKSHRLIGERTPDSEVAWKSFTSKYKTLFKDSIIKIRFKRDSKGQLRLQSAISYKNFKEVILKNKHIKIVNKSV